MSFDYHCYVAISSSRELDEKHKEALAQLLRERNKILFEVVTISNEQRAREAQRVSSQGQFTSFSYTRNMDFAEERRKLQTIIDNRQREEDQRRRGEE